MSKYKNLVKNHKGLIFAGVLAKSDVIYFKITKTEILYQMENQGSGFDKEFYISEDDGSLYVNNR